nr:hypothetical protein [Tanacetum cinerariifolium]
MNMDMNAFNESYNSFPSSSSYETPLTCTDGSGSPSSELDVHMLASENPKKRAGRKKFKETRHPVLPGRTHPNAEMAARAHDVAVLAMRGRNACLNFADSVWRLPVPESNDVADIQKAAAEAAEAFRHPEDDMVEEIQSSEVMNYVDEEDMPGFIDSMAEALMVQPPQIVGHGNFFDDVESYTDDMSLWSF